MEGTLEPESYHTYPLDWASLLGFGPEGLPWSRLALSFGFTLFLCPCKPGIAGLQLCRSLVHPEDGRALPEYERHYPSTAKYRAS